MSLVDLWKTSPDQLADKHVQQLIAFAGDGKLRDDNLASKEFRSLLGQITSEHLARLADECLNTKFDDNGLALQDCVNEIGRRLGFLVEDGRYRGNPNVLGLDGLWRSQGAHAIVVEVKTTDAYRIDLDSIANYRRVLVREGKIEAETSSVLIVVGRQDTGDLEAQIRGSKHAWDVRLISTGALVRMVSIKEELEDPDTIRRISGLLRPLEYTRLDGIVELVFAAATNVLDDDPPTLESEASSNQVRRQPQFVPVSFNQACADRIAKRLGLDFIRRSKATFTTPDGKTVLVCSVSKTHGTPDEGGYWFAFHPHQRDTLEASPTPLLAYGCGSPEAVLLVPFDQFKSWLPGLNMTKLDDREYWHIHIDHYDSRYILQRRAGFESVDLTDFLLPK